MPEGPFHVVAHSYDDVHETYAIYCNNRKYLVPPKGKPLKKQAAYLICQVLNSNRNNWPEPPATREELMAVQP